MVNKCLCADEVVGDVGLGEKASLVWVNDGFNKGCHAGGDYFGEEFVVGVEECDWSVVLEIRWVAFVFEYDTDVTGVPL